MLELPLLKPDWPAPPGVRAAVSLRSGGVSAIPYAQLNLGTHVGDDPAAVRENRARLRAVLAVTEPIWLSQQHGVTVFDADHAAGSTEQEILPQPPPRADAAMTRRAGRVLAVLVADCLPVLLARCDGTAVAIAHAGWRGLAAGVLEAAVQSLASPAASLMAWIGPGIGQAHFEVGREVLDAFCTREPGAAAAFQRNAIGRWQCDLHALAQRRLRALGLESVHGVPRCTYAQPEAFYSFRRDGRTGRMAALIWMDPSDRAQT